MSVSYIVDNLEVNFIIILFLLLIFASFAGQERYKPQIFLKAPLPLLFQMKVPFLCSI